LGLERLALRSLAGERQASRLDTLTLDLPHRLDRLPLDGGLSLAGGQQADRPEGELLFPAG
jgi:hypothetical protein